MLISLAKNEDDNVIADTVDVLHEQYPGETLIRFDQLLNSTDLFKESDGKFPTRLTFVGHSGWSRKYGGFTAEEFAEQVAVYLTKMAEINPEFAKNLTHIDLIGCHVGLVLDADDEDAFAYAFSKKINALRAYGNKIKVNAFTNLSLTNPHEVYTLRFYPFTYNSSFEVLGFKNKEFLNAYDDGLRALHSTEIKEKNELEKQADEILKYKQKMEKEYEQLNDKLEQLESEELSLKQAAKEIEQKNKQLLIKKDTHKSSITNLTKQKETVVNVLEQINLHKKQMEAEYKENMEKEQSLIVSIKNIESLECKLSKEIYNISCDKKYISPLEEKTVKRIQQDKREAQRRKHSMMEELARVQTKETTLLHDKHVILAREKELLVKRQTLGQLMLQQQAELEAVESDLAKTKETMNKFDNKYRKILTARDDLSEKKSNLEKDAAKIRSKESYIKTAIIEVVNAITTKLGELTGKYAMVVSQTRDVRQFLDTQKECNFTKQSKHKAKNDAFFTKASCRLFANDNSMNATSLNSANQQTSMPQSVF